MIDANTVETIEVFSTCPQSSQVKQARYLQHVIEVARWSEEAGCQGILVYTDNSLVDGWSWRRSFSKTPKAFVP